MATLEKRSVGCVLWGGERTSRISTIYKDVQTDGSAQNLMFLPQFSSSDFSSLFDLEHDLPDELISSSDLALPNGGVEVCQPSSLGPVQDTAAKHKQLSELLCSASQQQQQQQQAGMMAPGGFNRPMMAGQKGNGQQQAIMGGQTMNGVPRMGYVNANAGMNMADPLQQQQLRAPQPGAVNKVKYINTTSDNKYQ